jgi:hypothetical protein
LKKKRRKKRNRKVAPSKVTRLKLLRQQSRLTVLMATMEQKSQLNRKRKQPLQQKPSRKMKKKPM